MDQMTNPMDKLHGYYFEDLEVGMHDVFAKTIGTKMPGPGCIYVAQTLKFKAPVRVGDTVAAHCTVTELMPEKKFIKLSTQCMVGDKVVIDGEATIMVPSRVK